MSPPRFQHGYAHDVFVSYTHTDDQPDAGRRWVTQFTNDFRARLEIVSGHTVDIWRDEEKLDAADRFNDTIAQAVGGSAVLVVVLSPSYFNSEYCQKETQNLKVLSPWSSWGERGMATFTRAAADGGSLPGLKRDVLY